MADLFVSVLDGTKTSRTPIMDATVTLVPEDVVAHVPEVMEWPYDTLPSTYKHTGDGQYQPSEEDAVFGNRRVHFYSISPNPALKLEPGKYTLVAQKKGFNPVVVRLRLERDEKVGLIVLPGWERRLGREPAEIDRVPATVTSNVFGKGVKTQPLPRTTEITLRLFPRREVVLMAGADYKKGDSSDFGAFARFRAVRLLRDVIAGGQAQGGDDNKDKKDGPVIDPGTAFVLFNLREPANPAGKEPTFPTRRVLVLAAEFDRTAATRGAPGIFAAAHEMRPIGIELEESSKLKRDTAAIGVKELYSYLNNVSPETRLLEVGVFSHSFRKGPILWDTDEDQKDPPGHEMARDPKDVDGRPQDFAAADVKRPEPKKELPADWAPLPPWVSDGVIARLKGGVFKIWGCFADSALLAGMNAVTRHRRMKDARKETVLDDDVIEFEYAGKTKSGVERAKLAHIHQAVLQYTVNLPGMHKTYLANAARRLDSIQVRGAPPGMGASFGGVGGVLSFFLDQKEALNVGGYAYLRDELHWTETDEQGYLDYNDPVVRKLRATSPDSRAPWWIERWGAEVDTDGKGRVTDVTLSVATGFAISLPNTSFLTQRRPNTQLRSRLVLSPPASQGREDGVLFIFPNGKPDRLLDSARKLELEQSPGQHCAVYMRDDGVLFLMTPSFSDKPPLDPKTDWSVDDSSEVGKKLKDGILERRTLRFYW